MSNGINRTQSNTFLKSHMDGISLNDFYKKYLNESNSFPNLANHAKKIIYMFGSTYIFSKMKFAKNKMRSKLTDTLLDVILRLSTKK